MSRRSAKPGSWRLGVLAASPPRRDRLRRRGAELGTGRVRPPGVGRPAAVRGASQRPASSAGQRRRRGTVKVGFISPTTGFVAALGTDMQRGWELYWEQNGKTAGGVTVETVFEDDTGDPDVALTKAQRLVEEEGVQFAAGPILANTAYAVADYVAGQGIPTSRSPAPTT